MSMTNESLIDEARRRLVPGTMVNEALQTGRVLVEA